MSEPASEQSLFLHALGLPTPAGRAAYLDEACRGQPGLRAELDALLAAHDRLGGRLPLTTGQEPAGTGGEEVGAILSGRYKLVEQLGEGGMGIVWMAQQTEPVRRLVAVKVVKAGMDSKQVLARFEAERQALALMDHPNIAKVLDAGTTAAGRPYFVMELVKGVPITKYCDEHRLTPRQRLELLVPVCQAIQHAHQKGIIHRDIKPSNVLVALYDGKPVPKVIDFGIAKATGQQLTDQTLVTGFGAVVGTLEYMSPEQAQLNQLDIDTRSDVYSLGVLLYELLTGSTPLEKKRLKEAALLEVLRVIREEEPPRPSTRLSESRDSLPSISALRHMEPAKLTKLVRGELDWIVMKALDKERSGRYETANGLALDIQHYLHDEPVQACPPSAWYRLRKFARRNKAVLTAAALVGVALALGIVISTWQAILAIEARDTERKAHDALDAARAAQDEQRAHANQDLSAALEEVAGLREKARLAGPRDTPAWRQLRVAVRRAEALAGNALADAVLGRRVQALAAELTKGEADRRMMTRLDEIRFNQGSLQGGRVVAYSGGTRPAYEAAFKEYGLPVFDLGPEEAARRIAASPIRDWLVAALDDCASNNVPLIRQLLPIARRVYHEDSWRRQYFDARIRLDRPALSRLMQQPEALAQPPALLCVLPFSIEFLRRAQKQHPGDVWVNHRLAGALMQVAPFDAWDCVAFRRAALAARPESPALRVALDDALFHLHVTRGDYHAGLRQWHQAVIEYSKAIEMEPKLEATATTLPLYRRARAYEQLGQWGKVVADVKKAVEIAPGGGQSYLARILATCPEAKLRGPSRAIELARKEVQRELRRHPKGTMHAYNLYTLGVAHYRAGDWKAAIAALDKHRELNGGGDAQDWLFLAMAHRKLGHVVESQKAYRQALRCQEQVSKQLYEGWELTEGLIHVRREAEEVLRNSAHLNLGNALRDKGRLDEAVAEYRKAIALDPNDTRAHSNLGWVLQCQKKWDEAIAACRRAIELDPKDAIPHDILGIALMKKGQLDEAVAAYRKAIELDPKVIGPPRNLGDALGRQQKWNEAIAAYRQAIALDPKDAYAHNILGIVLEGEGQRDEAIACYRKAIQIDPKFVRAHNGLGRALEAKGQLDGAIAAYREAIRLNKDFPEAHSGLGTALVRQGRLDEAIAAFREAIRLKKDFAAAHNNLGNVLGAKGKVDEAIAEYRRALELAPKEVNYRLNRGNAYNNLGQYARALADYEMALKLAPALARTHNNLAWLLATCPEAKMRDPKRAVTLARRAVQLAPKDGNTWNTLGAALYRAGDWKAAVVALDKSRGLANGGTATDWLFLAMAYRKLGNGVESRKAYEQALRWLEQNRESLARDRHQTDELRRFRREAEAVLQLKKP
jgi:tetratricopeptide (TPR) repeat protein